MSVIKFENKMKLYGLLATIAAAFFFTAELQAQSVTGSDSTTWEAEAFSSIASGTYTPFWMASNRYGLVPLETGNGYLLAGVKHEKKLGNNWRWQAGVSMAAIEPRYRSVLVQELYAGISYKSLLLTAGSKENYTSLWDRELSSGDMVLSTNARPIPEINLSMPVFTVVPYTRGWLQVKGDFAVGRSFDTDYLDQYIRNGVTYVQNVLWHHKSGYLRIHDSRGSFPFAATVGIQHRVQWGGESNNPRIGKQPQSFGDFLRVIAGSEGGEGATASDKINVLGNHFGSYDMEIAYKGKGWSLKGYHQKYFDDKSGMELANGTDGLWGFQVDLPSFSLLRKVVVEHVVTRNQSGQFHFLDFDHGAHPGRGGGADGYYNNGEYTTGVSYFNRGLGSPLIPSPEYNNNGTLGFPNTRVSDWHLGLSGALSAQVEYRLLGTVMNTYGSHGQPFRTIKRGVSGLLDITYIHPQLNGWKFTGTVAADGRELFGRSIGVSLRVTKTGLLKAW